MSVVINYVSKYIALIATDTRVTFGRHGEYGFEDRNEKLVNLPLMGWSAGAGLSTFLDEYKRRLGSEKITDPNRIEGLFDDVFNEQVFLYPQFREHILETVASASWLGMMENDIFVRVGILSKKLGETMRVMTNDTFTIFYPSNYLENLKLVRSFEDMNDFYYSYDHTNENSLSLLIQKAISMFRQISNTSEGVSNDCDIGIIRICSDGLQKLKGSYSGIDETGKISITLSQIDFFSFKQER